MLRVSGFDPIEYLVRRKFPTPPPGEPRNALLAQALKPRLAAKDRAEQPKALANALLGGPGSAMPEGDEAAERYRSELLQKSHDEIARLCSAEQEAQRREKVAEADVVEKRRFYNLPDAMRPDYEHYCRCATWTLDEAVALSFGRDPERVNAKLLAPYAASSAFARLYTQRWKEAQRAKGAGQLWDPVFPGVFIPWALNNRIALPEQLRSTAVNRAIPLKNWQNLYEDLLHAHKKREEEVKSTLAKLREALEQARAETAALKAQIESSVGPETEPQESKIESAPEKSNLAGMTRRYNTVTELLYGLARSAFGVELGTMAQPSMSKLIRAYEKIGMRVDDETLRKHLRHGSEQAARSAKSSV